MELASLFPKATEAQWHEAVARVLKGAEFEKVLVGRTSDGIPILPLHPRRKDAVPIVPARGVARWKTVARFEDTDAERGNQLLHEDLLGGADALVLAFSGAPASHGFGLRDAAISSFDAALKDVHCDLVAIRLESAPFGGRAVAEGFAAHAARHRLPGATLDVDFGLQPLADFAASGRMPLAFATAMENVRMIIDHLQEQGFSGPFLRCDGRPFHDAGASEAQELACIVAQGVAYLRALGARGMAPGEIRDVLSFTMAADDDFLLTIAKFRALRLLWARIEEASGLAAKPMRLHGETAWRMLARRDVHTNLLRNTIAAFAAGIGGADSIEVRAFTGALGLADGAARRLARNTSLILTEESNLHRMVDPASGAGGIEALTDALCEKAWRLFQQIEAREAAGEKGLSAALKEGFIGEMIRDARDLRAKNLATRKLPITGISEFPDIGESLPGVLAPLPPAKTEHLLAPHRLSESYEALRDRADAFAARTGRRPTIFLANLGRIADFTARATFAKNFFEAGGFEVIGNDGFTDESGNTDIPALLAAFSTARTPFACIAASDALYHAPAQECLSPEDTFAEEVARRLAKAGGAHLLMAGRPGPREGALKGAGIGGFVFVGCNVLAVLDDLLAKAGA